MLDGARKVEASQDDFVEFHAAGSPARGSFRCSNCGYGVAIQATLPTCPMCGGTTWEHDLDAGPRPPEQLL